MTRFDYVNSADSELLVRFEQVSDQSAFAEIVHRHGPMVMATARRMLTSDADVEDAFQATFFALARCVKRLRQKDAVAAWLHQTARRTSMSIWRGKSKQKTDDVDPDVAVTMKDKSQVGPLSAAVSREFIQILDEEIGRLPTKLRSIVILLHLEGLSLKEAAKRLRISPSTAHVRLAKSRARLKARLLNRGVTMTLTGLTTVVLTATKEAKAMVADRAALLSQQATAFAAGNLSPGSSDCRCSSGG